MRNKKHRRFNQVYTTFMEGVDALSPEQPRKYTMTHSDETGDLFVAIGTEYTNEPIDPLLRDEVLLSWEYLGDTLVLYGEVLVDGQGVTGNAAIRNAIFIREMPTALKAIRYADREFFKADPNRDEVPILIRFKSDQPQYDKLHYFNMMSKYRLG